MRMGEKGANWKGGISKLPYSIKFTKELKSIIHERDNYQCQMPGCLCSQLESLVLYKQKLSIHHIDYNKMNYEKDKLISLCLVYHTKTNGNREYYEKLFKNILKGE